MKPIRTLLFFLIISIVLIGISLIYPTQGIRFFSFTLQYPSFNDITGSTYYKNTVAEDIIQSQQDVLSENTDSMWQNEVFVFDSTTESLLDIPMLKKPVFHLDTLKTRIQKIEFANNNKKLLHRFFNRLEHNKKLIRILHYGDSQIEGDRITAFLRNRFQKIFGGSGFGMIPAKPLVQPFSVKQSYSDNWLRYPVFGHKESKIQHKKFGGMGVFCRYAPYQPEQDSILKAWVKLSVTRASYFKDRIWKNIKIFYSNDHDSILTEIYQDDNKVYSQYLNKNNTVEKLQYNFSHTPKTVSIHFSGKSSPDIYAIALDANKGVVVDNIPMRGSSGTYFNKMDVQILQSFYSQIDLGMILLEFGGNVMPSITTEKGAIIYGRWFYSQIKTLKRLNPNVPIIVMGIADMSTKEKDQYVTYPYLETVRDMMKKAAFRANVGYWDMYEAMGGKNAMPEWVKAKPKLASNDYTHYTSKGARLMANMFYNALMYEYQLYNKK